MRPRVRVPVALAAATAFALAATAAGRAKGAPHDASSIATAATPPAPADLKLLLGKPVTRVACIVEGSSWEVAAPPLTTVKAGEPFSAAVARRAMQSALATGRFASARATASAEGGGVALVVYVVPRLIAAELHVDVPRGTVGRDELLRASGLSAGGELTHQMLVDAQDRIEELFARRGFPSAKTRIGIRRSSAPLDVAVVIGVEPGGARIVERRFTYVFGTDPDQVAALTASNRVAAGDRADEESLDAADTALVARFRTIGFHRAAVSHDLVAAPTSGTWLRVRVDAGPRFVARFVGNDHYDGDALTAALGLEEEGDRSTGKLLQRVADFYKKRGFLDAEVTLETRGGEDDATRYLVFHVVEGERVVVTSREYPCFRPEDARELHDGGPRSADEIGGEIDSFLQEELPGADLFRNPDATGLDRTMGGAAPPHGGVSPNPVDLDPTATYFPSSYESAVEHVRDLYRNEGFLHAEVGPLRVLRRRCDPRARGFDCVPLPLPKVADTCAYDASGLPVLRPSQASDRDQTCKPDRAHGVTCEAKVALAIPVRLGPRTRLWDIAYTGARRLTETELTRAADLTLGDPVSTLKIEEATRKIREAYSKEGFYYADVRNSLESSPDSSRARVRFDVNEGEQVLVRGIVIRGNRRTQEDVIRRRIALHVGEPYRSTDVRSTQELVALLNVFESVDVTLEDPYLPQKYKTVVVTVVERTPIVLDFLPGFSTGDGVRGTTELGLRNVGGRAIGLNLRVQLAYLPDFMIYDDPNDSIIKAFADKHFTTLDRVTARITTTVAFPDVGLGPRVRASIDGIAAQDLQRGFQLRKAALIPGIGIKPARGVDLTLSQSIEFNSVVLLLTDKALVAFNTQRQNDPTLNRLLIYGEGPSLAAAQKLALTWDRRDSGFSPHRGTYLATAVEHVDSFALPFGSADNLTKFNGHFLRLTATFSGYIPLPAKLVLAASMRMGQNVQLVSASRSHTYPDRQFFLGGADSLRGFAQDSVYPQDRSRIYNQTAVPPITGGDLLVNPRVELRIPVWGELGTVAFFDAGNLWVDPASIKDVGSLFLWRSAVGTGIRWNTPVGLPVALDVGFNLMPRVYERRQGELIRYEIQFAMGLF